jgi:hypothetical protein
VRRTTSVDMEWPDGAEGALTLTGRGRDIVTLEDGAALVLATATLRVTATPDRVVWRVTSQPRAPGVADLVGLRLGPGFRAAASAALGESLDGSLLALLVDDLPVTALISGFGLMRSQVLAGGLKRVASVRRIGTCTGWRDGGAAAVRAVAGEPAYHPDVVAAEPPEQGRDPDAWHAIPALPPQAMRRRRRLDVMPGADVAAVEAWFRDTVAEADGSECALHEYTVRGEVAVGEGAVGWLESIPHVLPYVDCSGAAPSSRLLDGTPLRELRAVVRERLTGVVGCTHLNDALRSVADVDHLLRLPVA